MVSLVSKEEIGKHILNTSVSKQMYSFPKAQRFKKMANEGSRSFYFNLPSVQMKRSASIGYGTKYDFTKGRKWNAPFYNIERMFDKKRKDGTAAYSFGLGREHFKKNVIDNIVSEPEKIAPGPGKYETTTPFGTNSPKYSMKKKTTPIGLTKIFTGPGPANYNNVEFNPHGKYPLSKIKNSPMAGWSLSKAPRFIKHSKLYHYNTLLVSDTPGPNAYPLEVLLNGIGNIYNSKYTSCMGKSFIGKYKGYRYTYLDDPGPGAYQSFSEFGIYDSRPTKSDVTKPNINSKYNTTIGKSSSCGDVNNTKS